MVILHVVSLGKSSISMSSVAAAPAVGASEHQPSSANSQQKAKATKQE
jgi:hypothetical protein